MDKFIKFSRNKLFLLGFVYLAACTSMSSPQAPPAVTVVKPVIIKPEVASTQKSLPPSLPQPGPTAAALTSPQAEMPVSDLLSYQKQGVAAWYALSEHGRKTASGELYDLYGMTAAHATLPLGTRVRVDNLRNKRNVVVSITDRLTDNQRLIKLSYQAARRLDLLKQTAPQVEVSYLSAPFSH